MQHSTCKKRWTSSESLTHLTSGEDLRYKRTDVIERFACNVLERHRCCRANLAVAKALKHQWQHAAEDFWVIVHPLSKWTWKQQISNAGLVTIFLCVCVCVCVCVRAHACVCGKSKTCVHVKRSTVWVCHGKGDIQEVIQTNHVESGGEEGDVVEVNRWHHVHQHWQVDRLLKVHTFSHWAKHEEDAFYCLQTCKTTTEWHWIVYWGILRLNSVLAIIWPLLFSLNPLSADCLLASTMEFPNKLSGGHYHGIAQ